MRPPFSGEAWTMTVWEEVIIVFGALLDTAMDP